MLLHDVVNVPDLGIRVLHGDTDALARPVLRACTTDMPDPTRYVTAESLVFTGLVWRRSAEDTDLFVKRLVAAGVAAMAAGEALHGGVPDDVVDACVRHRLPLLAVPDHVPFSRVIEHMTGRMAGARMDVCRRDSRGNGSGSLQSPTAVPSRSYSIDSRSSSGCRRG